MNAKSIIALLRFRVAFGKIGGVGSNFISDHSRFYIISVRQP